MNKHVLILGGDGYLGWPTAMHFSNMGYEVTVVDNYLRRHCFDKVDVTPLFPVPNLIERARIWYELTGKEIKVVIADLAQPHIMRSLFEGSVKYNWALNKSYTGQPETVIHYAEQPSAPLSLLNYEFADMTLTNNLRVTNNLMFAVRDLSPDTHIIKLGTMGEYGTPNIDIEEGWLEIEYKGRKDKFLFPRQAGSLYHTTKIMDTDLLWFGVRMWNLKVTDLMQGPVYGFETPETKLDSRLSTIFNYDEIYGTVINRFIVQAVIGRPLTVYGKGGQTRGYLNINDTLQCITKTAENPPEKGKLQIYNQMMENFSVNDIAEIVSRVGNSMGLNVKITNIENPRKEAEEHYYNPMFQGLIELGVKPHFLTDELMESMLSEVSHYKNSIRRETIFNGVKWLKN